MGKTTSHGSLHSAGTVLLGLAGLFVVASVWTYSPADWPSTKVYPHPDPPHNACGVVGAWLAYQLFAAIGPGAYVAALATTGAFVTRAVKGRVPNRLQRCVGVACLITVVATAMHLWWPTSRATLPEGNGGVLGVVTARLMQAHFSSVGTGLILAYVLVVSVMFTADGLLFRVPAAVNQIGRAGRRMVAALSWASALRPAHAGAGAGTGAPTKKLQKIEPRINPHLPRAHPVAASATPQPGTAQEGVTPAERQALLADPDRANARSADRPGPGPAAQAGDRKPALVAGKAPSVAREQGGVAPGTPQPGPSAPRAYPAQLSDWRPPSLSLLLEPTFRFGQQQESFVRDKAGVLERALADYRIEAQVVEIDAGPVITMYELQLAPGVKVSQITALSNDLSRVLKAPLIRVVSPIPGKNTIGVEVPNPNKENVRLRELMVLSGTRTQQMSLPLFLGKDASGNPLISDLARMPHMLIAGTTGSGKSVCLNAIILSLLMTQRPDVVKLILVDPKMVELSQFRSVPHLMCPIVTEIKRAAAILDWAVTTMDERYEILAEARVRNIAAYNRLGTEEVYRRFAPASEQEKGRIAVHLPHIVIIIDELADLMLTCGKEVEYYLSRLAQKSRAVGVHIIVATQRPEAKIVTGLIKSNLPCRIAFRVSSRLDSRIVLDQNGAEMLLGQGDMLFLPPGTSKLVRAQGTLVEEVELKRVLDDLAGRAEPEFHPDLVRLPGEGSSQSGERDELFDEAVRIVLETGRGSVSLLQRRLMIGYSRASRLIDLMAEANIVGQYKGSQAREVNMTLEEWEAAQTDRKGASGTDRSGPQATAAGTRPLVRPTGAPQSAEAPALSGSPTDSGRRSPDREGQSPVTSDLQD